LPYRTLADNGKNLLVSLASLGHAAVMLGLQQDSSTSGYFVSLLVLFALTSVGIFLRQGWLHRHKPQWSQSDRQTKLRASEEEDERHTKPLKVMLKSSDHDDNDDDDAANGATPASKKGAAAGSSVSGDGKRPAQPQPTAADEQPVAPVLTPQQSSELQRKEEEEEEAPSAGQEIAPSGSAAGASSLFPVPMPSRTPSRLSQTRGQQLPPLPLAPTPPPPA